MFVGKWFSYISELMQEDYTVYTGNSVAVGGPVFLVSRADRLQCLHKIDASLWRTHEPQPPPLPPYASSIC